jgi:hypothetical protein
MVVLAMALISPPAAVAARSCVRPGDTVVLRDRAAVVVARPGGSVRPRTLAPLAYYGCLRSAGKRHRIDYAPHEEVLDPLLLAGRYLAYLADGRANISDEQGYGVLALADLKTLRVYEVEPDRSRVVRQSVQLRPTGSTAYLLAPNGLTLMPRSVVTCIMPTCFDRQGYAKTTVFLDTGAIPGNSLQLHGRTLTWTNAGQPKSAILR